MMRPVALLPVLCALGLASAAVLGPELLAPWQVSPLPDPAGGPAAAAVAWTGEYLEARDCTVFGGPCHVNGEAESQGRCGVIAWRLDGGGTLVAALESAGNLGRDGARRAVLFADGVDPRTARALAAEAALEVVASRAVPVTWSRAGDRFDLRVEGALELSGAALADRSCCSMPQSVWYAPLASRGVGRVLAPVVGNPERCRFAGAEGLAPWTYEGDNTVFVGRFEVPRAGA